MALVVRRNETRDQLIGRRRSADRSFASRRLRLKNYVNVATTKNRARLYDRNFVRFGRFLENADGKTARNFARQEDRRSNSRFQRMIRISGFEEGTCSFQQIVTSTWQRSNEEIKGRRNRQEDLESPHDLPLFFFFFCLLVRGKKQRERKREQWSAVGSPVVDSDVFKV